MDVWVINPDAKSRVQTDPDKVMATHEKKKKAKYLDLCLTQRHQFTPFVVSTDGMVGREATTLVSSLALKLSRKWQ